MVFLAPFYYLGQSFSMLIAYYEHLGADPEEPVAMGVSTYGPVYNFLFLNNGYHAEHHYQPKRHWTQMKALRNDTREKSRRERDCAFSAHRICLASSIQRPGEFRPPRRNEPSHRHPEHELSNECGAAHLRLVLVVLPTPARSISKRHRR
ncbi:fatty acid desaturase [Caulobacter segnis]